LLNHRADSVSTILQNARGLLSGWRDGPAWRILDTRFGTGLDFLTTWQAWRRDALGPRLLHYVALTDRPADLGELLAWAAPDAELSGLAGELAGHWTGLLPGFHRFSLDEGHVLLTLCVGELAPMLRQQQFLADAVYLKPDLEGRLWDRWAVKALARCCRRGTRLVGVALSNSLRGHLAQSGFELELGQDQDGVLSHMSVTHLASNVVGQFNPHWVIKNSRSSLYAPGHPPPYFQTPGTCTVIGAGLAGAGVAAALARRGWQVQVLDTAPAPASGASGLPAGLVVPHVSADDCTLSRLSRSGVRLMLQQAKSLLNEGQDWAATGTLERRVAAAAGDADVQTHPALWHAQAAWLKPEQLVRAWLAQPGVTFKGSSAVAGLRREGQVWDVLDAAGQVLARADRVVIANAMGAAPLMASLSDHYLAIAPLPALQGVRGQVSWGLHAGLADEAFPPFPVNGSGSVIPHVPSAEGPAWYVGANYQPETQTPSSPAENHRANLGRASELLPHLGAALSQRFPNGEVNSRQNTRCVTTDRLPWVGPLTAPAADETQSSVWLCVGMGSRGLTFSALCAELLAAQWHGEPLPIEASLATALDARRHAKPWRQK